MTRSSPGILLRSPNSEMGERVFYVEDGRRYWVQDGEWIKRNGYRWEDIHEISPDILASFYDGGTFPKKTSKERVSSPRPTMPGILLRSPSSEFGERVFYVTMGRRYWVRDRLWMDSNGFVFPDDIVDVSPEIIMSLSNGGAVPIRRDGDLESLGSSANSLDLREIAAANLQGVGIEFGAGASPFPLPLTCYPLYADVHSYETLIAGLYPGQAVSQLVRPHFVTDLQTLRGIADGSMDFVVACHVIEHTVSPITAIAACHRALKPGGTLLLVVPDMEKTFDRNRQLTTLQHLIDDHISPSRLRDREHFDEFYTKVFPPEKVEDIEQLAARMHANNYPIHYHCWNYASFSEMMEWVDQNMAWTNIWSHPTLDGEENIEFYFVLTK
jgi:predicted SAM-dependent methyltransferase